MEYSLKADRLQSVGRMLDEMERAIEDRESLPGPAGEALPAFEAKVLRAFIVDGRLTSIPAQEKKRLVVLRYLTAHCFAEGRAYPEREINEALAAYNEDVAALRRYIVGAGLMTRSGGEYRRT